jgi:hypothetical protein
LSGQWSTVNFDRAETGPRWAGSGLDTGRVGPVWAGPARHVASAGAATSPPGFWIGLASTGCGSWWTCECSAWKTTGFTVDRVHPSFLSHGSCAPSAQTGSASAPPLFLPAVRRRRRAPACSTWWRSRTDPSGPTTLLGLREGDKGVLAADLSS